LAALNRVVDFRMTVLAAEAACFDFAAATLFLAVLSALACFASSLRAWFREVFALVVADTIRRLTGVEATRDEKLTTFRFTPATAISSFSSNVKI
jgi:hypothetical protein